MVQDPKNRHTDDPEAVPSDAGAGAFGPVTRLRKAVIDRIPHSLRKPLKRLYRSVTPSPPKPLMYRVYLFEELLDLAGREMLWGKRILEIGPRDGLDSKRLAALEPTELVMIDLPSKRELTARWLPEIACPNLVSWPCPDGHSPINSAIHVYPSRYFHRAFSSVYTAMFDFKATGR